MSTSERYAYRAALSYALVDRPWAARLVPDVVELARQFAGPSINIFYNADAIDASERWDQGPDEAFSQSQHLILLWSKSAAQSKFVREEIERFRSISAGDSTRRIVQVLLDK